MVSLAVRAVSAGFLRKSTQQQSERNVWRFPKIGNTVSKELAMSIEDLSSVPST